MDIMIRVGSLFQEFDASNQHSLCSLAMVCGIFTNPKQESQTILLHWSPLKTYTSTSLDGSSFENLLVIARNFFEEKFTAAVTQFQEHAYSLMRMHYPITCFYQLNRGNLQPFTISFPRF